MKSIIRPSLYFIVGVIIFLFLQYPDQMMLNSSYVFFGFATASILLHSPRFIYDDQRRSLVIKHFKPSEGFKLYLLFAAILCIQFASLHEHIFGSDRSRRGLYEGVFTHGGYMPYTDNGQYLIGIQSFLRYGMTVSMSVFRPSGSFWSAFLYKISGESMMFYFYLQAFFSAIGIFAAAMVLRRYFSWFWVLLFTWLLSEYAGLLQGTFLTELTSMPFALLSFSLILYGWSEERINIALIGVSMLAIAFEMRPAVFLYAPMLFLLFGVLSMRDHRYKWKYVFLAMMIYAATSISCRNLIGMLTFPPPSISNTYGKIYQIYQGSEAWNEVNKLNPKIPVQESILLQKYRQEYVQNLVLNNPIPLIKNYLLLLKKSIQQPQRLFEVIDPMMSKPMSIVLICSLLAGFIIHKGNRLRLILHLLVFGYLLSAIFSFPFLHAELRVMSATQVLVILAFVLALHNICTFIRRLIMLISYRPIRDTMSTISNAEPPWYDRVNPLSKIIPIVSIVMATLAISSPLVMDSLRKPLRNSLQALQHISQPLTDTGLSFFILDVRNSPMMKFEPGPLNTSTIPPRMSLERIRDRWDLDSTLQHGFYLFSAINHLNFEVNRYHTSHLVIPTQILSTLDIKQTDAILLEVRKKTLSKNGYIIRTMMAERIVKVLNNHP